MIQPLHLADLPNQPTAHHRSKVHINSLVRVVGDGQNMVREELHTLSAHHGTVTAA